MVVDSIDLSINKSFDKHTYVVHNFTRKVN